MSLVTGAVVPEDPTSASAHDLTEALNAQVVRLALSFERPPLARPILIEVRGLLRAFQSAEARHVSLGLANPAFPFAAAQERLGSLRRAFGGIVQVALDALRHDLVPTERAELERVVLLARTAPLTSVEDLAATRTARSARSTSAVA